MLSNDFYSFNYYDSSIATNSSLSDNIETWAMMSYFGRINYNYKEKYLLEANLRYDGSSRLAPSKRWKAFPSVSAAWRVNEEEWFNADWVSNLKLRASWGQLGNGAVLGLYDYIPLISYSQSDMPSTYFGERWYYQASLASEDKTWETVETTNLGIDFGLFNNRLSGTFEYYWKFNNDMLSALQLPSQIGIDVPNMNVGKLKTWGWDFNISWRDKIKDFSYQIAFNISDSNNKLVRYDGASYIGEGLVELLEGYPINTIWGYQTDGFGRAAKNICNTRRIIRDTLLSMTVLFREVMLNMSPKEMLTIQSVQVKVLLKIMATWFVWETLLPAICMESVCLLNGKVSICRLCSKELASAM